MFLLTENKREGAKRRNGRFPQGCVQSPGPPRVSGLLTVDAPTDLPPASVLCLLHPPLRLKPSSSSSRSSPCSSPSSTAYAPSSWWWFLSSVTPSTPWWASAWPCRGRRSTTSASTSRPAPDRPSSGRPWVSSGADLAHVDPCVPRLVQDLLIILSSSLVPDKISLLTQKVCMCCLASPDIDLDNIDVEKMK